MDIGSAYLDPVDFFSPSGGVLTWTFLFLANADGAGAFNLSRILGGADLPLPLVEHEHPVESLSRVVSDVDGYTLEFDNSSNEQSFLLDSTVKLSLP